MFIEGVKLVGSIVGLLTGLFVVWDRLIRSRPFAYLDPRKPTGYQGGGEDIFLIITNPADHTIFVDIFESEAGVHFLEGRSRKEIDAAIRRMEGQPLRLVVPARSAREIEMSSPSISSRNTGPITINLEWRPAHSIRWDCLRTFRRPIMLRTSFEDLRRMRGPSDLD